MATYKEIQNWVKQRYGWVPKDCWIAHCKELNGLPVRQSPRCKGRRLVPCPEKKRPAIEAALRYFEILLGANMDISDQQDCELNIRRIEELLSCGIFEPANSRNILQSAAFIELMICLRDLLHKTEKYAKRISFTDDVMTNEYVYDITDAVTAVRDACCHINSSKRLFDDRGNRGSFMVIYGKGNLAKIDDLELKSDYEDDIAFFYGKNRLYINRHIVRAFKEATALLAPMLPKRRL